MKYFVGRRRDLCPARRSFNFDAIRALLCALVCLLVFAERNLLLGQGVTLMHTGVGGPLSSQSVSFTGSSSLTINLGFATDEQPQPGLFPDSFTVSISGPNGIGYLVTLDASGTHWTPFVPGALPVDMGAIQWQASPFLASTAGLTNLASYALGYTLPPEWQNVPLNVNFDLFDNQNLLPSLAYFTVPVPEPSAAVLLILSAALCAGAIRQKTGAGFSKLSVRAKCLVPFCEKQAGPKRRQDGFLFRDQARVNTGVKVIAGAHGAHHRVGAVQPQVLPETVNGLQSRAVRPDEIVHPEFAHFLRRPA